MRISDWISDVCSSDLRDGRTVYRRNMLAALQRRELLRVARRLSDEVGKPFVEMKMQEPIQGRLARAVDMTSGRQTLVERSRDFTLVPWRPVMERHIGKNMSGIMRDGGVSWKIGRASCRERVGQYV